ncbi:cutinase family protein [Glaciihabitans tibetensis]|nr:cutinase family protein [Glaciihabitans tibetensis]
MTPTPTSTPALPPTSTPTSTPTPTPTPSAQLTATPVPTITGTIRVGQVVTAVPGVWAPAPVSLHYQWSRAGVAIPGATAAAYTLTASDSGKTITVTVTGSKAGFSTVSRTSVARAVPVENRTIRYSGSIAANTTWSKTSVDVVVLEGAVTVAAGVTLTIEPGVVVKFQKVSIAGLYVYGTLRVAGSSAAPVVMTSALDDSAGGDTNLDGARTSPTNNSEWSGIVAQPGSNVDLVFLEQRFGEGLVHHTAPGSNATVITDSRFSGSVQWGPGNASSSWPTNWKPSLVFTRNIIEDGRLSITSELRDTDFEVRDNTITPSEHSDVAIQVWSPALRPSRITGNSTPSSGWISLQGTLAENWSVAEQGRLNWAITLSLRVPAGISVTLPAGTRMGSGLIYLEGTLTAAGAKGRPVDFLPAGGEDVGWGGIEVAQGGTLRATYLNLKASAYDDAITRSGSGRKTGNIYIADSFLAGNISLWQPWGSDDDPNVGKIIVKNTSVTRGSISVNAWFSPAGSVVVTGNTVDYDSSVSADNLPAYDLSVGDLVPANFAGNQAARPSTFRLEGTITGDWTLPTMPNLTWSPQLSVGSGRLVIPPGTTLERGYVYAGGDETAEIVAIGTASKPIVFHNVYTSLYRKGTLTGQHVVFRSSPTGPYDSGPSGIGTMDAATLLLDDVTFEGDRGDGSGACVYISREATGHLRGDVSGCAVGVAADGRLTAFDATGVNWGSADGPPPFGSGAQVIGNVSVVPWVGYTEPATTPAPVYVPGADTRCVSNLIIAVRGSGEVPGGLVDAAVDPDLYDHFTYAEMTAPGAYEFRGLGDRVQGILTGQMRARDVAGEPIPGTIVDHADGLLDSLGQIDGFDVNTSVRIKPLRYPAASVDLITKDLSVENFTHYLSSMSWGLSWLLDEVKDQVHDCPDQKIALVGYSQGSLVIQMALAELAAHGSSQERNAVNAVLMLANPVQDPGSDRYTVLGSMSGGSAANQKGKIQQLIETPAVASLIKSFYDDDGMNVLVDSLGAKFPPEFVGRTLTYCNVGDLLCAPQDGMDNDAMGAIHGGYTPKELAAFGRAAAGLF